MKKQPVFCDTSGPALHAATSILSQACVPPHAWCLGWLRVRIDHRCVRAVVPWKNPCLFQKGVRLVLTFRRKVVTTDTSRSGWGTLGEGNPAFSSWSTTEQCLHINCLEMLAVLQALKTFLQALRGHHVLARSDSMTVVAYIKRQGDLRSHSPYRMARRLLIWAHKELLSLRSGSCARQF